MTRTGLRTEAGVVLGTVAYMSPEQVRGEALDARSDIFSLGIVLFEMLSATRPFEGATTADVMSAVLRADPPPLVESIPASLRMIVQRCLHSQPTERFQSASDLAFALRNVTGGTAAAPVTGAASSRTSFRWLAALLVAVAGGLAALAMYAGSRGSAQPASLELRPFATEGHGEAQPIWSPDGRSIAYVASIDGKQNIFVKSVTAPGAVLVLRCPALCDTVSWSADGSRIFYNSRISHLDARMWSVARTGGDPAPAFKGDVQLLASAFSRDGKRLAVLRVIARLEARVRDPHVGGTPRARRADMGKRSLSGHIPDPS